MLDFAGGLNGGVETDPDAPATALGTDQPVRHAGTFFTGNDTSINSRGPAFRLDPMLLVASAPLIVLNNSVMSLGTSASSPHGFDLVNQVKMSVNVPGDAMIRLNASTLNIVNGHGINVAGGSFLKIVGDLISLANHSTLTIANGAGLFLSGGSSVSISGGAVKRIGTGHTNKHTQTPWR